MSLKSSLSFAVTVVSIVFLIIINTSEGGKGINCDETYSCSNTSISQKRVRCFGSESCKNSNIECNRNCAINGYNAAQYSSIISHNNVRCDGYQSCNNLKELYSSNNFYCDASQSSMYSNIDINGDAYLRAYFCLYFSNITGNGNGELDISSPYAAYYANIRGFSQIEVTGYYGIVNSKIYSNGNDITINMDGYYAGRNAEIYCESGDTCIVNCNGRNGCYFLTVYYHINSNYIGNCDSNCSNCDYFYQNSYSFNTVEELKQSKMYLTQKMETEEQEEDDDETNRLEMSNNNNDNNDEDDKFEETHFGKIGNKLLSKKDKINIIEKTHNMQQNEEVSRKPIILNQMSIDIDSIFENKSGNNGVLGFNDDEIVSMTIGASLTIILSVVGYVLTKKNID